MFTLIKGSLPRSHVNVLQTASASFPLLHQCSPPPPLPQHTPYCLTVPSGFLGVLHNCPSMLLWCPLLCFNASLLSASVNCHVTPYELWGQFHSHYHTSKSSEGRIKQFYGALTEDIFEEQRTCIKRRFLK